jgi:endonuclease-3
MISYGIGDLAERRYGARPEAWLGFDYTPHLPSCRINRKDLHGMEPEAMENLAEKAVRIHARLCAEYGCPVAYFHNLDPLSELVSSMLSHRTKNADSSRAFRSLRAAFPTWEAVRDAPPGAVQTAIVAATWPEQKAPRIQAALRIITERLGSLTLDPLAELPEAEARAWLQSIPGVGPKTSAAVLSFSSFRRRALPVDSHHFRVAARLGLIPPRISLEKAHALLEAQLPADWEAQQVYDNHEVMMFHGKRVCTYSDPACPRCVVLDLCPFGQARLNDLP